MEESQIFTIKIGGAAGQGIKSAGLMLAKLATRSGYHTYNYVEYPSLIRGGHNVIQISISKEEVAAPSLATDLLVALNPETVELHLSELRPGAGILFDDQSPVDSTKIGPEITLYPVPLSKLASEAGHQEQLNNTVALGAVVSILGGSLDILKNLIQEAFGDKGEEVAEINLKAAEAGFNSVNQNKKTVLNPLSEVSPQMIIDGNEAVALGAIAAGLQFAAIYPMSPVSNILHTLAQYQEQFGFIYKQPEDEIAAINMSIGASYAGARSLTTTSGGGFCLMSEGFGLAGMTETPLVIVEGMRGGPATGLPTWSEQGDLQFILHAAQGDFPRIVLAPGDVREAFDLTMQAFNLADKYQTPVVVLIDKNICEHQQSLPILDISSYEVNRGKMVMEQSGDYERYQLQPDGISPRSVPGKGNYFITNSYTHNNSGFSTEKVDEVKAQMEKRMNKLKTCIKEDLPAPALFGSPKAQVTIVSWGSNKGPILQALKKLDNVNFLHLTWLNPFPVEAVRNILAEANYLIDIECNYTGQLAALIREKTGIEILDKLLKYDGRPIFPEEIVERINTILKR